MSNIDREVVIINTLLKQRYLIFKKLSNTGRRLTFLAQDSCSEELVVIKILLFANASFKWDDLKLFEREAQTLKNLDYPAIPKYLNYFEIDYENFRGFALVQTYIDALSLETIMKEGRRFSEVELIEFAEKILAILIYLHQQIPAVIHRDLKPSNILIANRSGNSIGDVYLVDFGAAQIAASKENGTITIVGSYGYIPLEQFGGQTTTASDLYSLGMTLIYLITGVHPAELPQVNGRAKFSSSDISGKFARWLDKVTHPHLDKRFNSAKSALTALKSKDGSSGDFLDLRPVNSQVKLHRECNKLKIVYQCQAPGEKRGCWLFLVLWFIGICLFGGKYVIMGIFVNSILYGWFNSAFPSKPEYYVVLIDRNGEIRQGICSSEELTEVKRDFSCSHAQDINLIAYNPGYIFDEYLDETGREIKRGTVVVHSTLSIYAGHIKYQISGLSGNKLSQAELWWLGQELSDFLGLELQIIYPTPKAPPEPSSCGGC